MFRVLSFCFLVISWRSRLSTLSAALHVCIHPSLHRLLVFSLSVRPEDKTPLISAFVGTKSYRDKVSDAASFTLTTTGLRICRRRGDCELSRRFNGSSSFRSRAVTSFRLVERKHQIAPLTDLSVRFFYFSNSRDYV